MNIKCMDCSVSLNLISNTPGSGENFRSLHVCPICYRSVEIIDEPDSLEQKIRDLEIIISTNEMDLQGTDFDEHMESQDTNETKEDTAEHVTEEIPR